jgi:hypothetical protein
MRWLPVVLILPVGGSANNSFSARFDVRREEVLKDSVFWDLMSCGPLLPTCFLLVS